MKFLILIILVLAGCSTHRPVKPVVAPSTNAVAIPAVVHPPPDVAVSGPPIPDVMAVILTNTINTNWFLHKVRVPATALTPSTNGTTLTFECDPLPDGIAGLVLYAGNAAGSYWARIVFPATNEVFMPNVDVTLPWHFAAAEYTGSGTNIVESVKTADLAWAAPACRNYLSTDGINATLVGWGTTGSSYTISGGVQPQTMTNSVTIAGTNGLWTLVDPEQAQMFYSVATNTNP